MSEHEMTIWLLEALRTICWHTGQLEGHDVLTRAIKHLNTKETKSKCLS